MRASRTSTAVIDALADLRSMPLLTHVHVIGWIESLVSDVSDEAKIVEFLAELTG